MGQGKQRHEKQRRLYETTRGGARVLNPVRPVAAQAFVLVLLVGSPRRPRYEILDYHALQQTADSVAAHFRQGFPDKRFSLVAFPVLYPLFGLYEDEEYALAYEASAHQAALAAGVELDTQAWCMERTSVAALDQAAPELQHGDAEFDTAVLCYLPIVVISEESVIESLGKVSPNITTGTDRALGELSESQNLEVRCVGLFPSDNAHFVYEMLAGEALATRIAHEREAQPRFHFFADHVLFSAGNEVWLGQPQFATMVELAEDEEEATLWLMEHQRFTGELRRRLTGHGLTVRTALLEWEEDHALAEQTLQELRSGTIASGENFVIEAVEGEAAELTAPEQFQLTQYFYEEQFVLGVLSATHGASIAFQQNLYPCSATGQEAIVAYAEQSARAAGRPLERIRHDGAVLVCEHCFEPVPLISDGDENAQPLTHSLH